jgi:peptidoglycan/xylan/chitin deacetylase (PgdA/CDA1 family)
MRARLFSAILMLAAVGYASRPQYVAVAFHDVVDKPDQASDSDVTAADLISFFEWLRANGWTAITLDDIERAQSGTRLLPDRAILLTFDDGFKSLYTRVYPLLLAYRMPAIAALVGSWMEGPKRPEKRVGDDLIPGTDNLISWDEAREMQRSGLVEFASQTYALHHSILANPQGGELPAAAALAYDRSAGYETEAAYRQRIRTDLEQARAQFQREIGIAPRALVWPFGRRLGPAQAEAVAANYRFQLTLGPEPGFLDTLPLMPRLLAGRASDLPALVKDIALGQPAVIRLVRLSPEDLSAGDPAKFEKALGAAIERLKRLGATTVVVNAAAPAIAGRLSVWFPNRVLPVRADVLSRIVWQLQTRAHVEVAVWLPVSSARAAAGEDAAVLRLFQDLGASVRADALLLDHTPALVGVPMETSDSGFRWDVRRRRNSIDPSHLPPPDALAMRAFLAFDRDRPSARLFLLAQSIGTSPSSIADLTLVEAPLAAEPFRHVVGRLAAAGWLGPVRRYNCGVWFKSDQPPSAAVLSHDVRFFQARGGVALGWERDDPSADEPKAAVVAPAVSAATVPTR